MFLTIFLDEEFAVLVPAVRELVPDTVLPLEEVNLEVLVLDVEATRLLLLLELFNISETDLVLAVVPVLLPLDAILFLVEFTLFATFLRP